MATLGGIISISYSGTLVSFLSVSTFPKLEHSIESLLSFHGHIGTLYYGLDYQAITSHSNPKIRKLGRTKYKPSGTIGNAWKMVVDGTYAYMNSKTSSEYNIKTRFTDRYIFLIYYYILQITFYLTFFHFSGPASATSTL